MEQLFIPISSACRILALGAESDGNFSFYQKEKLFFFSGFGDLLKEDNFQRFQKAILSFLKKEKTKPDIILTDLHPLFKTTLLGKNLSQKFKAKYCGVQHHHAHLFASIADKIISCPQDKHLTDKSIWGVVLDGTGYGLDEKIWGGEIFRLKIKKEKFAIERIGHLENQIMIGGELAITQPARMLISILSKINNSKSFIYKFIRPYYNRNEFELLYNQLQQNFNCQETSSTGRILDAVAVLLGLARNQRKYKHEATKLLEENSTNPYFDLNPKIEKSAEEKLILNTTYLFKYLIKNLHQDKKRLAATAQLYIAQGIWKIIKNWERAWKSEVRNWGLEQPSRAETTHLGCKNYNKAESPKTIFLGGGLSTNKIISSYLKQKGAYLPQKIPAGDAGISVGQILWKLKN